MGKRRKKKKINFEESWLGVFIETVLFFAAYILLMMLPGVIVRPALFFLVSVYIIYHDNSGIRKKLVKKLPKKFPWYKSWARPEKFEDHRIEVYKTCTFFCLLLSWGVPYIGFLFTAGAVVFPVLTIVRYIRNSDRISFSEDKQGGFTSVVITVLVSGFLFFIWGADNHRYNQLFWVMWGAISLTFIIPFFLFSKEYKRKILVAAGYIFCVSFFWFGALCVINIDFDFSAAEEYRVRVVDKHSSSGKAEMYYVTVKPWDGKYGDEDIEVSIDEYKQAEEGDIVTVVQRNGLLRMKWYYLEFR